MPSVKTHCGQRAWWRAPARPKRASRGIESRKDLVDGPYSRWVHGGVARRHAEPLDRGAAVWILDGHDHGPPCGAFAESRRITHGGGVHGSLVLYGDSLTPVLVGRRLRRRAPLSQEKRQRAQRRKLVPARRDTSRHPVSHHTLQRTLSARRPSTKRALRA
jgi:hypothetical protein